MLQALNAMGSVSRRPLKEKLQMRPTGVTGAWAILIILLFVTIFVLRVRWTVALLLFFFGPFAGTLMTLFAQMLGQIGEAHRPSFLWLVIGVYALDFPYVLGLHSAVLATVLLVLYSQYEGSLNGRSSLRSGRRLITGALIGGAVGGLFAALILLSASLANQNPEFIDFISGGTRDRLDLSTELLLSICTGAFDGALTTILGVKCFRPQHLDGAVESATT
jgi:hypothetical protein